MSKVCNTCQRDVTFTEYFVNGDAVKCRPCIQAWMAEVRATKLAARPCFLERVCGGEDAAGHGCGAPLGVYKTSRVDFEATPGVEYGCSQEHCDDEWDEPTGSYRLKVVLRPCRSCREI